MARAPSGSSRSAGQQDAGGVPVQPVHQARTVFGSEAQGVEHPVEVAGDAGAPLDRQAVRFVQHEDLVVLVDDGLLQILGVVRVDPADRLRFRRNPLFRDLDGLTSSQACVGVRLVAVHPDLTVAAPLLNEALLGAGKAAADPAVEAYVGLVVGDGAGLVGHALGLGCLGVRVKAGCSAVG
jgi:hypothetical protein